MKNTSNGFLKACIKNGWDIPLTVFQMQKNGFLRIQVEESSLMVAYILHI